MQPTRDLYLQWLRRGLEQPGKTQTGLAVALGLHHSQGNRLASGSRPLKTHEIQIAAEYLGIDPPTPMVRVVGTVGADPSGRILHAEGDELDEWVPIPPGGTTQSVAVRVDGHSMRGIAENGSLIYYEDRRDPPGDDMLGYDVVVGLDTGEVLLKRLLRGSQPGLFDLESRAGETRSDQRVLWAAHVTAIIPPWKARQLIRRMG